MNGLTLIPSATAKANSMIKGSKVFASIIGGVCLFQRAPGSDFILVALNEVDLFDNLHTFLLEHATRPGV